MNISMTELVLLCWAMLGTGFYLAERSKLKQHRKFMDFIMTGVANKEIEVTEDEDGRIHVRMVKP